MPASMKAKVAAEANAGMQSATPPQNTNNNKPATQ